MILFQKECEACRAKDDIISFLKEQINKEKKERLDERAEYKRTVDVLLMKNQLAPVGQGVAKETASASVGDVMKQMASIFEEADEVKNAS